MKKSVKISKEVSHDIMEGKCVFTKGEIQLYKENRKDSEIIGKLLPEKRYQVTEFETQCGLNGNEIDVDGKKAKLLSYMGEGIYKCYVDGITKTLNTGTNQIKVGQMPQVWVRVKTESTEGWFSVGENVKNMHAGKSTGVFIPEKYPKDLIMALAGEPNPSRDLAQKPPATQVRLMLKQRATSFLYNDSVQAVTKTRKDVALWQIV